MVINRFGYFEESFDEKLQQVFKTIFYAQRALYGLGGKGQYNHSSRVVFG
jgi:hypothetical protein